MKDEIILKNASDIPPMAMSLGCQQNGIMEIHETCFSQGKMYKMRDMLEVLSQWIYKKWRVS